MLFNWFKNKEQSLLPPDIGSGLMSANFCEVKVGTKISVPENIVCFVSYKDKLYATITNATFVFNETNLNSLYKKQLGKEKSLKKLNLDLFFVNLKRFSENFDFLIKLKVKKEPVKLVAKTTLDINVFDAKKFSSFVLSDRQTTDAKETFGVLREFVEFNVKTMFSKSDLEDLNSSEQNSKIFKKLTHEFEKIGVKLNRFNITFSEKTTKFKKSHNEEIPSFFDSFNNELNNKKSANKNSENPMDKNNDKFFENEKSFSFAGSSDASPVTKIQTQENTISTKTVDETKNMGYTNQDLSQTPPGNPSHEQTAENSPQVKYCVNCGRKLINGAKFCHSCGAQVD